MSENSISAGSSVVRKVSAVLAALTFVSMVTANALANALPLNGVNTGQLSDEIPNLFVPTGLTFAIWGLIYLLLAAYIVLVLRTAFGQDTGERLWDAKDGWLFAANAVANAAWIFAWHWRMVPLSMVIMLVILGTLIALEERNFKRFGQFKAISSSTGSPSVGSKSGSPLARFLLTTPINVYLGWICVATIANATALLVKGGWDGFGLDPRAWTVTVIIAGLAVALSLAVRRKAVAAPLVVVWAYLGIVMKRTALDPDQTRSIWITAIISILVILGFLAARIPALIKGSKLGSQAE